MVQEDEDVFQAILKRSFEITSPKLDPEVWLHIWDSGGQPVFLDVLPAFLKLGTLSNWTYLILYCVIYYRISGYFWNEIPILEFYVSLILVLA